MGRCAASACGCWGWAWPRCGSCARAEPASNPEERRQAPQGACVVSGIRTRESGPVDRAADHADHLAAGPDLAFAVDVHVQARVVAVRAALAAAVSARAARLL